jgi:GNAT superfamily N-acetyltransferase
MEEYEPECDISLFLILRNGKRNLLEDNAEMLEEGYDYPVWGNETLKELLLDIAQHNNVTFAIRRARKVIGFFSVIQLDASKSLHSDSEGLSEGIEGKVWETVMFIHKDHRGGHVSRLLHHSLASAAKRLNLNVVAYLKLSNARGIKAYRKAFRNIEPVILEETQHAVWRLTNNHLEHWQFPYKDKELVNVLFWDLMKLKA